MGKWEGEGVRWRQENRQDSNLTRRHDAGAKIKHRLRRHAATRAQGALRGPSRRLAGMRATVGGPCTASGKIPARLAGALVVRELPRAQGAPARGLRAAAG